MSTLLLITIIAVAIVTCFVVGFSILSLHFVLKSAKKLSSIGALDEEFKKEEEAAKKPSRKILGIVLQAVSGLLCVLFVSLAITAGVYRAKGEQFVYNDHVSLVIASESMRGFYDDKYEKEIVSEYSDYSSLDEIETRNKLVSSQFDVGDILQFRVVGEEEELVLFDVYAYKVSTGLLITHRLISIDDDGSLIFRGDNTPGHDIVVERDQVLYRYEGQRTPGIGVLILFFGSGFGIYSVIAALTMFTISDIAIYKYEKLKKARLAEIGGANSDETKA